MIVDCEKTEIVRSVNMTLQKALEEIGYDEFLPNNWLMSTLTR